ncbi:MAG: HD domain-containing protein, partial [Candidatus Hydrothermarchaeaceae archaeon]
YRDKERMEEGAAKEILSGTPDYHELWLEYSKGESSEARMVKAADKLELFAQALEYEKKGFDVGDFWEEEYPFSGVAKSIYDLLKTMGKGVR